MPINRPSFICPVMVGRTPQLGMLLQLVEEAVNGHGRVALITGEAGIGKSRLLAELKHRLKTPEIDGGTPRCAILETRCFETDQTTPYIPIVELLTNFSETNEPILTGLIEQSTLLARLMPEFAKRANIALNTFPPDTNLEKRHFYQAFNQFLNQEAANNNAAVLVLEDAHWCDEATLELLLFLARRIQSQHVFLLLSYRSDEVNSALAQFLADLERERLIAELPLVPLALYEVDTMIRGILQQGMSLRLDIVESIYHLSEGNPFFIEEILKTTITDEKLAPSALDRIIAGDMRIPRTIQVAVERRTAQLSLPAQNTLTLAAVIGQRFDLPILHHLTRQSESDVLAQLKELIGAQLVLEETADQFTFRHALTRQAVYTRLLGRERQPIHLAVARALEQLNPELGSRQIASITYHYYQAGAWEKVIEFAPLAGASAQALYSPRSALDYYSWAIEATQKAGLNPPTGLWQKRGQVFEMLGNFDAASVDYLKALETAIQEGSLRSEWQSLLDLGFLLTGHDYDQAGVYLERALQCAQRLNNPDILAETLNRLGNWNMMLEHTRQGLSYHHEALRVFRESGNPQGMAATLDLLGVANYIYGDMPQGAAFYEQAIEHFRTLDDRLGLSSSLAVYAVRGVNYICYTTAYPAVPVNDLLRNANESAQIARQINWRSGEASALMYLAMGLGPRGEYRRAIEAGQVALDIATEIDHLVWTASANMALGLIYTDIFALELAENYLKLALEQSRQIGARFMINSLVGQSAMCLLLEEQIDMAQTRLQTAIGINFDSISVKDAPVQSQGHFTVWWAQAQLEMASGSLDRALQIVDTIIEILPRVNETWHMPPRWSHLRGQVLYQLGRTSEAEACLLNAHSASKELGMLPLTWRIEASLGKLYQSLSKRKLATVHFAAARNTVDKLASELSDENLRQRFVTQTRKMLPQPAPLTSRQAAKMSYGGLSARECDVAALIAQGKTTLEIASELVLSERTIEKHIENILSKLAFRSRVQIATWATEKGLVTPPTA